jgi:hypothetical protein
VLLEKENARLPEGLPSADFYGLRIDNHFVFSDDLAQRNESSQQKPVTAEVSRRGLFSAKAGYAKSTTSSRAKEQTQKKRSTVDKNPEWKP